MNRAVSGILGSTTSGRAGFTAALLCFLLLGLSGTASAQIAGETRYSGTESGKIFVEAFTENDAVFEKLQTDMINPGTFAFENVAEGQYTVIAYIDSTDNGRLDADETWVEYGQPVSVPPGDQNVVLNLDEPGVGGGDGDGDDDNGCCAVVASPRETPAALAVLFLAAALLATRRRS